MLTIKILCTINSLKKKLFRQNTIYNSFRLKKPTSFWLEKIHLIKQKLFELKTRGFVTFDRRSIFAPCFKGRVSQAQATQVNWQC